VTAESPQPRRKRLPRIAALLRTCHLYLSMTASLAIAFFALSGLVANLRDETDSALGDLVPESALATPATAAQYLQQRFALPTPPTVEEIGDSLYTSSADRDGEHLDISLYRNTRAIECVYWQDLPTGTPLDRTALQAWLENRFHGEVESSDDADPDPDAAIQFRINSVWWSRTVTVERSERRWGVSTTTNSWGQTLTALHTGRYASAGQRLLTSVIAAALLLSVLSGTLLGLLWLAQARRRIPILTALLGGVVCLLALLIGR
jgi:hypothetical protein